MVKVADLDVDVNIRGNASKQFNILGLSLTDIRSGFAAVTRAVKIAADAFASFTTDIANAGDQAAKTAKNLGIGVQAVQELDFAAKIAGVGINEVRTAIQRMQKGLNDARRTGTGPFADSLEQLGVKLSDFDGLEPDEIFERLSTEIAGLDDATTKAALAQDFFGRGGKTLLPLLNEGAEGIRAMRREFQGLGGGFRDEGAAAAEEFNDSLLRMNTVVDSIKIAIGSELLPVLREIIVEVQGWLQANREVIKQRVQDFLREAIAAAKRLTPAVLALVGAVEALLPLMLQLAVDTGELARDWDLLVALILSDLRPALNDLAITFDVMLAPVNLIVDAFNAVADAIGFVLDKLGPAGDKIRDFIDTAAPVLGPAGALLSAALEPEPEVVQRAALSTTASRAVAAGRLPKQFVGGGTTEATASSSQLRQVIANKSISQSRRDLAREFLPVAKAREGAQKVAAQAQLANLGATGRKLAGVVGESFLGLGQDFTGALDRPAKKPTKKPKRRGGGGKAAAGGTDDIESLLSAEGIQKRVAEGKVTPTILVTITNNNIEQNIDAPVTIQGVSGTTAQQVGAMIQTEFGNMLEAATREAIEEVESKVNR